MISTHQVRDLGTLMDPIVILHQGRVLLEPHARRHRCARAHDAAAVAAAADAPDLLFSEPAVGGFWSVWRGGGDGPLDLEVLFNAVVANPDLARSALRSGGRCRVNDATLGAALGLGVRNDLAARYRSALVVLGTAALVALLVSLAGAYDGDVGQGPTFYRVFFIAALFAWGTIAHERVLQRSARPRDQHGVSVAAGFGAREDALAPAASTRSG